MSLFTRKNDQQPIIIDADETYEESLQREARQLKDTVDRHVAQSNLQDQIRHDRLEEESRARQARWDQQVAGTQKRMKGN